MSANVTLATRPPGGFGASAGSAAGVTTAAARCDLLGKGCGGNEADGEQAKRGGERAR